MKTEKDLEYYRKNAEEDYLTTPISVLRYIGEMEKALRKHDVVKQSEQLVSFLRQYQKTCEIMHVNKIDAENFVEQYKTN